MNRRNLSIGTKTSLVCGLSILILLSLLSFAFFVNQERMMQEIVNQQESVQKEQLNKTIKAISRICEGVSAPALYNFDNEVLNSALLPHMDFEEIIAIEIVDSDSTAFLQSGKPPKYRLA